MKIEDIFIMLIIIAMFVCCIVCCTPVNANEAIKSAVEQHAKINSSGVVLLHNQKKDNAESSCQGITIEKSGGIIIINQRVSDKDVLDVVEKK